MPNFCLCMHITLFWYRNDLDVHYLVLTCSVSVITLYTLCPVIESLVPSNSSSRQFLQLVTPTLMAAIFTLRCLVATLVMNSPTHHLLLFHQFYVTWHSCARDLKDLKDVSTCTYGSSSVSAVSIKLLDFNASDPTSWFLWVEAQFGLHAICSDNTKY